ncbi:hypothetical protein FJY90_05545 [Candidatus Gottesmanbacteria bacterium]|nr:hypothetical protein [Candidatus Gottesmanbacteria bacterium]
MLVKRTNILFDEELWQALMVLAKARQTSVGRLVREAVKKAYLTEAKRNLISQATARILSLRKSQKKINYKELIDYGRKY